jgi:hypothetical protein
VGAIKNTKLTALGGIITALTAFFMFLSGTIPFMTYVFPAIAGALIIPFTAENENKWAFLVYAASSVISALTCPDKEPAILYITFFGWYVIFRSFAEKKLPYVLGLICKLAVFNASFIASYMLIIYVFALPFDTSADLGKYTNLILLAAGNVIFILYDAVLGSFILLFKKKYDKKFDNFFKD